MVRTTPIEIHASDASPAALAKARRGVYARGRSLLPSALRRVLHAGGDGWRIGPDLHRRITWSQNLAREERAARLARRGSSCAGTSSSTSPRTVSVARCGPSRRGWSPGYLCVGVSESLLKLTSDFDLQEIGGAFVYVKR
jgi:chemotaxis protein methyltransferase CheR